MTITATKPEAFTLPRSIKDHFEGAIRQEMILTAFNTCNYLSKTYVRQELPRRFPFFTNLDSVRACPA